MSSFFLNPITMWAGLALVSTPIIIHLINRMRFRRVKWAAMEFLLKAQKKMRRKKILEQLLLLLLRCLLVFLAGLLFARFLGFNAMQGKETRPTSHVIILDDSPSMADKGRTEVVTTDAFDEAKKQITERIMPAALEATTDQSIRILKLSDQSDILNLDPDPAKNKGARKIDAKLIEDVRGALGGQKPSNVRGSLVAALNKAKELLEKTGTTTDTAKIVHVVTDLRALDWEQDGEALQQTIRQMGELGIKVHLVDVVAPGRLDVSKPLLYSDNVGIVEFKPRTRVAASADPVDFEVRLKNFGNTDLKDVQVFFFLNGKPHIIQELQFPHLPAGQERTALAQVTIARSDEPKEKSLTPEQLQAELKERFQLVTAVVANQGNDGLAADNVRHAVIEVRKKLSVLVIPGPDEDVTKPPQKSNDSFYLRRLFQDSYQSINWVTAREDSLDKLDLKQFSTIFLLNVPRLTESQAKNLENYVREGGGVGIFLGPKVDPVAYNNLLHKSGEGLFPVPLPDKFTEEMTKEQKDKRGLRLYKRILLRDSAAKTHQALSGINTNERGDQVKDTDVERFFMFVNIDQYWPVSRLGKWRDDKSIQELFCLPNENPSSRYLDRVMKVREAINAKLGEPKFEKFRDGISKMLDEIRQTAEENDGLPLLARQLDRLLADQVNDGSVEEAVIREFWGHPEMAEAKAMALALRDETKFGNPLYFAKRFENGRVAVMTTSAGEPWSDWASGAGAPGWVAVMKEMQKYLAGGGAEENRSVGGNYSIPLETGRYQTKVERLFLTAAAKSEDRANAPMETVKLPDITLLPQGGVTRLNFNDNLPGVYVFILSPTQDEKSKDSNKPLEFIATAMNVDASREGALLRAKGSDLADQAKGAEVHSADDNSWLDSLKQKPTDASSGRWLYLVVLLILIFEQAMAVRLSYHRRPEDLEAHAPSAAAAFSHGTSQPASEEPAMTEVERAT